MMLGLRQSDLAKEVGISPSYLNLIEHNRRRIGGKLLVDLARKLEVEASLLAEGAEAALLEDLREAAAGFGAGKVDLTRIDEFAGRFPGWAQLLVERHRRVGELERIVETLTDRMTHDPFLSASLHEVLSTVTAIRSTAAILSDTADLDHDWQVRFHRNLRDESHRLTESAQALVSYLDDNSGSADRQSSPREEVEAFLQARDFHIPELEGRPGNVEALIASGVELTTSAARDMARRYLARYAQDAQALPLESFAEAVPRLNADPGRLAQHFGTDPGTVFRRLATLPEDRMPTRVGLVICDGSGTLTFRRPLPGFALPRFGAACALWPLYQALSQPTAQIRAVVEQPARPPQRFLTYALCQPLQGAGFGAPQVYESAMLILPDQMDTSERAYPVGTSCRICPRGDCPARREPSILSAGI